MSGRPWIFPLSESAHKLPGLAYLLTDTGTPGEWVSHGTAITRRSQANFRLEAAENSHKDIS